MCLYFRSDKWCKENFFFSKFSKNFKIYCNFKSKIVDTVCKTNLAIKPKQEINNKKTGDYAL